MTNPTMGDTYELIVREPLGAEWAEWLAPLALQPIDNGGMRLVGLLPDQAALHGLLNRLRDLNLTILSVRLLSDNETSPTSA